MGSMAEAMRLADATRAEQERVAQLRAADLESHAVTFAAYQCLGATIAQERAQEAATAVRRTLGDDVTAVAIVRLVGASGGSWRGTATTLLAEIGVPLNPVHLGRRIRKIARLLRLVGIRVHAYHVGNRRPVVIDIRDAALFNEAVLALTGSLR